MSCVASKSEKVIINDSNILFNIILSEILQEKEKTSTGYFKVWLYNNNKELIEYKEVNNIFPDVIINYVD